MTQANKTMQSIPSQFEQTIHALLRDGTTFKEHELMQQLVMVGFKQFTPSTDALELFQTHFLLFHFLYQLQGKWLTENRGFLDIHTLEIRLNPPPTASKQTLPAGEDSLREYYLNLDHLTQTTHKDVNQLLDDFWEKFDNWLSPEHLIENLADDLELLELSKHHFTEQTLQKQRKKLLQEHHPDKGGDSAHFNKIQQASCRLAYYLKS